MNQEQLAAAQRLISLMDGDKIAEADTATYGHWIEHLMDHVVDIVTED